MFDVIIYNEDTGQDEIITSCRDNAAAGLISDQLSNKFPNASFDVMENTGADKIEDAAWWLSKI